MALSTKLEALALGQRGHLYPWVPVAMALGIGRYFAQSDEPALHILVLCGVVAFCLLAVLSLWRSALVPFLWPLCLVPLGFMLAGAKAHLVAGPKLEWRYYGAIEGRVIGLDRSASGALRVTLDRLHLERHGPDETPRRARVALHGRAAEDAPPVAGSRIMLTAHLTAPGGPIEPGGFDFQRHAWFQQLGAVGYARAPVMLVEEAGASQRVARVRYALAARVQSEIGGEAGAFAAAIMTGDRAGMSQETIANLRHTNLAHLLAISGLHMGLLSGFVYAMTRYGLLLLRGAGQKLPMRKTAALVALIASFAYLLLSGGSVATERAFVMATVALGAVFFERRVFSMRSVATAAIIVLALRPEALLGPGFQMSFSATTALVWVFSLLRHWKIGLGPVWLKPVSTVVISSAVAGLATAPIAAAHFNLIAHYGLLANLAAVPLMGALVIPSAVMSILLMPLGLSWLGFAAMEFGVRWILGVAQYFAELDGARGSVISPDGHVLVLLAVGMLFLVLWQGRLRLMGLLPIAASFFLWVQTDRPDVLIAADGKLVGIKTPEGRALSKPRGSGFVARGWLENDGSLMSQEAAAALWQRASDGSIPKIMHIRHARDVESASCKHDEILVASETIEKPLPCQVFDLGALEKSGAVALIFKGGQAEIRTARTMAGRRLWNAPSRD